MTATLEARVHGSPSGATIDLAGDIDGTAREGLDRAYGEAAQGSPQAVLLDFADVSYINSTGIALIVGLLGRARADGVAVAACGLSDHYREIFEITRLSDFMAIYADEATARSAQEGRDR
jgi:anti-sigma B factor antagonist